MYYLHELPEDDRYIIGVDPYEYVEGEHHNYKFGEAFIKLKTSSNIPKGCFGVIHPDGRTEVVKFEWDDVKKKNKVIIKKVK